jgi:hypothetical protein
MNDKNSAEEICKPSLQKKVMQKNALQMLLQRTQTK